MLQKSLHESTPNVLRRAIVFVENYGNRVPVHLMTPKLCPTKPGPRKLSPARKCPYDIVPLNFLSLKLILTIFKDFHLQQL